MGEVIDYDGRKQEGKNTRLEIRYGDKIIRMGLDVKSEEKNESRLVLGFLVE